MNTVTTGPASAPVQQAQRPGPGAPGYQRVLLKLSGEVFGGGRIGVDPDVVHSIAEQIAEVVQTGVQVAVVVGGGELVRWEVLNLCGLDGSRD